MEKKQLFLLRTADAHHPHVRVSQTHWRITRSMDVAAMNRYGSDTSSDSGQEHPRRMARGGFRWLIALLPHSPREITEPAISGVDLTLPATSQSKQQVEDQSQRTHFSMIMIRGFHLADYK
jgi:hypothetical protein